MFSNERNSLAILARSLLAFALIAGSLPAEAVLSPPLSRPLQPRPRGAAATNVVALPGPCGAQLRWQDNSSGESGYTVIMREVGSTGWRLAATLPANSTSASIHIGQLDAVYEFQVVVHVDLIKYTSSSAFVRTTCI